MTRIDVKPELANLPAIIEPCIMRLTIARHVWRVIQKQAAFEADLKGLPCIVDNKAHFLPY